MFLSVKVTLFGVKAACECNYLLLQAITRARPNHLSTHLSTLPSLHPSLTQGRLKHSLTQLFSLTFSSSISYTAPPTPHNWLSDSLK